MEDLKYTKDPITGAVVFNNTDGYNARKKVIAGQKLRNLQEQSNKKVINSMRSEINTLTSLVESLLNKEK